MWRKPRCNFDFSGQQGQIRDQITQSCKIQAHLLRHVTNLITSTIETKTGDIMANAWPAEKVGAPHCKGTGKLNLKNDTTREFARFSEPEEYGSQSEK